MFTKGSVLNIAKAEAVVKDVIGKAIAVRGACSLTTSIELRRYKRLWTFLINLLLDML